MSESVIGWNVGIKVRVVWVVKRVAPDKPQREWFGLRFVYWYTLPSPAGFIKGVSFHSSQEYRDFPGVRRLIMGLSLGV